MLAPRRGFDHIRDGGSNIQHQHQRLLDQECGRPHLPPPSPNQQCFLSCVSRTFLPFLPSIAPSCCDAMDPRSSRRQRAPKERRKRPPFVFKVLYCTKMPLPLKAFFPFRGLLSFLPHRSLNQHTLLYIFVFIRSSNMLEAFSLFHFLSLPPLDTDITELTFRTN